MFSEVVYPPNAAHNLSVFRVKVPLMHMSYLGTLKGWLYTPLFHFFHPGVWSLRIPVLLAGVATLVLFAVFLRRIHGGAAAVFGAALLASDPSYLLTDTFDWGPVGLQILLTMAALLLLIRRRIFWGFFCLGLALWHKALMLWILGGLGVAALALFPREFTRRRLPAAVLGMSLGAFPFVLYNIRTNLETFRQNSSWDYTELGGKARLLRYTLEGSALFGYLVHEDHEPEHPIPPQTALDRAAYGASAAAGRRAGWLPYALAASLLTLPLLWRTPARKPMLFALIVLAVGWFQMGITKGAGGGVHHTVLLWPFPHMIVAVAAGELSRRTRWVAAPLALLIVMNLLVLNQYYVQIRRNGGADNWSDACFPLTERLVTMKPDIVFLADWGFFDTLRLLSRGSLRLSGVELNNDQDTAQWLAMPNGVFVVHSPGSESFQGRRAQLLEVTKKLGYRTENVQVVHDRNQRPRFEIYRFSSTGLTDETGGSGLRDQ